MHLFAQIEGAAETIQAANNAGWAAGLVAVVVVAMLVAFGVLAKIILTQSANRELSWNKERDQIRQDSKDERKQFASEKGELEKALVSLTEKVTEATTTAAVTQTQTNECLTRFSNIMDGVNGDIRELCDLLKNTAVCPYRNETETNEGKK